MFHLRLALVALSFLLYLHLWGISCDAAPTKERHFSPSHRPTKWSFGAPPSLDGQSSLLNGGSRALHSNGTLSTDEVDFASRRQTGARKPGRKTRLFGEKKRGQKKKDQKMKNQKKKIQKEKTHNAVLPKEDDPHSLSQLSDPPMKAGKGGQKSTTSERKRNKKNRKSRHAEEKKLGNPSRPGKPQAKVGNVDHETSILGKVSTSEEKKAAAPPPTIETPDSTAGRAATSNNSNSSDSALTSQKWADQTLPPQKSATTQRGEPTRAPSPGMTDADANYRGSQAHGSRKQRAVSVPLLFSIVG